MGTEKRERQKANRQLKYQQQAKEAQRRGLTRKVVIGIVAVVAGVALVLFLAFAFGSDDDEETPTTTTAVPSSSTTTATTTAGAPSIVPFWYGGGPCPPDPLSEPVTDFDAAPQLCIDPAATYTARFDERG